MSRSSRSSGAVLFLDLCRGRHQDATAIRALICTPLFSDASSHSWDEVLAARHLPHFERRILSGPIPLHFLK